jgi:hypothetical protein
MLALALLCAAPVLGFLPRLLGPRTGEPQDRRPTWAQVVVVTCGELPPDLDLAGPGFSALAERAAGAALRPMESPRAGAASLWTGRAPDETTDGDGSSLAPGAWTLADAARRTGAATAAFLAAPLASQCGIAGFDTLVESPDLDPERLASLADAHLAAHAGERSLVWLHLADPGPRGAALDELLALLHASLERYGHRFDALVAVTPLAGSAPRAEALPLWIELPNSLYARRQGRGAAEITELTSTLLDILRLPGPDVTRGELPIAAPSRLPTLLQGGAVESP